MRHFITLLKHELRVLLISPGTYIAAILFLIVMGFVFQDYLTESINASRKHSPGAEFIRSFWLPVFFIVPLLTMKSIAEERRTGTLETLMTTPVTPIEIVLSKFSAAYLYYICLWIMTFSFQVVLYYFAQDPKLIDPAPLIGGYTFIALSGFLFISIGIFSSSLTKNQLVAAILSFAMVFIIIIVGRNLTDWFNQNGNHPLLLRQIVEYLQIFQHAEDFTSGVVETRPVVFYLSGAAVLLTFSIFMIETRNSKN